MYATYLFCLILILASPIAGLGPVTLASKYERSSLTPVFPRQSLNTKGHVKSAVPQVSALALIISDRQKADNRPLCPQFKLKYGAVRKATHYLIRKNQPVERRFKRCEADIYSSGCDDKRKKEFVATVNKCVKAHSFSACFIAIGIFNRIDWVHFPCITYLKSSRIGNCYVLEYLTLNGYRGKDNKLVFYRESGIYDKKRFQCTAGTRTRLPLLKNRLSCRGRFRLTPLQVGRVHGCALPGTTRASTQHSRCLGLATGLFGHLHCYNQFTYNFNIAYINCIIPHGLPAVAVASASIGASAIDCPGFRRDSWVGQCKAGDYVQLRRLKLVSTNNKGYLVFKRRGLCKY